MSNTGQNAVGSLAPMRPGNTKVFSDFIRIAVPILLLLCALISTIHVLRHSVTRNILSVRELSHVKIGQETIRSDVQTATSDLMHLAGSSHLMEYLESGSMAAKALLAEDFHSVLQAKKHYDQVRYLDDTGMEVVRVNYNAGLPQTVPEDRLQNKGQRYYFSDTYRLPQQKIFVSPMDLNIENGRIEQPLKPMLRYGAPVYDRQGRKRGVLLINCMAEKMRRTIGQFLDNTDSNPMMVNAQGYWLLAPDPKDEWGFMFNNQRRFDRRYPDVWQQILREKSGQVKTDGGLFTFVTIYPLLQMHISSTGAAGAQHSTTTSVDDKQYFWVLLTHIPQARHEAEVRNSVFLALIQLGLASLIVFPLVWLFSRERIGRQWAGRELQRKEHYLRAVTSQLAEGLLVIDRHGAITTMNKEAEYLLEWESGDLIGRDLRIVFSGCDSEPVTTLEEGLVSMAINGCMLQRLNHGEFQTRSGESIPVSFSVAPFENEGDVEGAIITFRDISDRLKLEAELKVMATHDPLTGIKNRREIERLLHSEFDRSERYQRPLTVLMVDIDHFKRINDTYGHPNGDSVLRIACDTMVQELRGSDVIGRYGGEEFLVILPETARVAAVSIAERLRQGLARLAVPAGPQHIDIRFTVSIGVATFPESAASVEDLVRQADELLYQAKKHGRNRVVAEPKAPPPPSHLSVVNSNS